MHIEVETTLVAKNGNAYTFSGEANGARILFDVTGAKSAADAERRANGFLNDISAEPLCRTKIRSARSFQAIMRQTDRLPVTCALSVR
jgi:hypothetical protein